VGGGLCARGVGVQHCAASPAKRVEVCVGRCRGGVRLRAVREEGRPRVLAWASGGRHDGGFHHVGVDV